MINRKLKKNYFQILQILISVILLVIIILKYRISLIENVFNLHKPEWLLISIILTLFVIPILAGLRWKIFLIYTGIKESIISLMRINFISIFWGILLPSSDGFAIIRMFLIEKKYPNKKGIPGSTIIAEKLFGFLLLCLLGIMGSYFITDFSKIIFTRLVLFLVMLFLIAIVLVITNKILYSMCLKLLNKISIFKKFISYIINLHKSITTLPYRKIILRALPIMLIFQISTIFNVYLIFKAMNVTIPFFYHIALIPIIQIISLIPITISGFGVREGAFVYFYSLFGIDPSTSFSVSIINFLILTGVPALIGGLISIFGQIHRKNFIHIQE